MLDWAPGGRTDQAAGLRRLFGSRSAQVIAFASAAGTQGRGALLARTAMTLASMGQGVAVVDENGDADGPLARLGVEPRCDLFHALVGECAFGQAVVDVAPLLRAVSARRAAHAMARGEHGLRERYAAFLDEAKRDAAYVLIGCAKSRRGASLSPLALNARHIVVVSTVDAASITGSYALIKRIAVERGGNGLHLAVTGARNESDARAVFANIQQVAQAHLGITLGYLGHGREHFAHALNARLPPSPEPTPPAHLPATRRAAAIQNSMI
ncbi:MinD/ParA family protein [Denitratisoma sp. DHT3]|uniref:MinD/ParA family ATP-binding protein n=1 Tax=Denitratisoma sp. DHT3 TaxID=1981880 RepID=UPI0011A60378|nr:MinD/ParA family protein [Denitratisoma sp. DHT3]